LVFSAQLGVPRDPLLQKERNVMRKKVAMTVMALLAGALLLPADAALARGYGFGGGLHGGGFHGDRFGGRGFAGYGHSYGYGRGSYGYERDYGGRGYGYYGGYGGYGCDPYDDLGC
jgi:hypothetical protein